AARLADVVRCPRIAGAKPVACRSGSSGVPKQSRRHSPVEEQSIFGFAAALHSGLVLSISLYDGRRTSRGRRLVETPVARRIFSRDLKRTPRARSTMSGARLYFGMPKEEQIVTEGTVTEVLPGTMFRVDLGGQRNVRAHISGTMRRHF